MPANTNFTSGQILTAAQQNNFPRGIMASVVSGSNQTVGNTEVVTLTTPAFTAVAGRLYRITYYEPWYRTSGAVEYQFRIRYTNTAGASLQYGLLDEPGSDDWGQIICVYVGSLVAGSITICATGNSQNANNVLQGTAEIRRTLVVEDIGLA
jgi:hypothetical protein